MRMLTMALVAAVTGFGFFPAAADSSAKSSATFKDCADCPEMVTLPAGSFLMGSPDGEEARENVREPVRHYADPQHMVTIDHGFAIAVNDVTRGQYAKFVAETKRPESDDCITQDATPIDKRITGGHFQTWKPGKGYSWRNTGYAQTDDHPVTCVSWDDAKAYADWLSAKTGQHYRLVNEAEWEYAARAGTTTARYWGDDQSGQCKYANLSDLALKKMYPATTEWVDCDDGFAATSPVGYYLPNAWGLYDMIGNVWQWTADCWTQGYAGAPADGDARTDGDCSKAALRGGGWEDIPWSTRAASRFGDAHTQRTPALGFRVARDL